MARLRLLFLSGLCCFVAGCGVKPSAVKQPESDKTSSFPRTYPNVNAEPQP